MPLEPNATGHRAVPNTPKSLDLLGNFSAPATKAKPRRAGASTRPEHPMTTGLAGIQACVFDAYGTLFDFASAARGCRDVLGVDADRLTILWRDKQLQY